MNTIALNTHIDLRLQWPYVLDHFEVNLQHFQFSLNLQISFATVLCVFFRSIVGDACSMFSDKVSCNHATASQFSH